MEVVIASSSSPGDGAISAWELSTGEEQQPRHKDCSSPPHGLASVGGRFLASSQSRDPSAPSGSVFYWSWEKPQVEVKSFPEEPIGPLIANKEGTFIIGGGVSGEIYLWEVPAGRLLRKWHAHYRGVTCLVFSDDGSLLISGSEDGSVRVWSLYMTFDDLRRQEASHLYVHNFTGHNLRVTDVICGYGGSNSIIISASEDRTCKVWSLSKGILLRNVLFSSVINAISLDPGEHVFYAGSRDGRIYIAALNAESNSKSTYGMHIIGSLSDYSISPADSFHLHVSNSKAVTCLTRSIDGNLLVSGSEDGLVKVWDIRSGTIVRMLKHSKGPVNNVLITRKQASSNPKSSRKHGSLLPPPLRKYESSGNGDLEGKSLVRLSGTQAGRGNSYITTAVMNRQIEEFQRQGSAVTEFESERLKSDQKTSMQLVHKWQQMFDNIHQFCIDELLDKDMADPPGTA